MKTEKRKFVDEIQKDYGEESNRLALIAEKEFRDINTMLTAH